MTPKTRVVVIDLLVIGLILIVSFWIFGYFDALESIVAFAHKYEEFELDELIPTAMVLVLGLLWFSVRRWREAHQANRDMVEAMNRVRRLEGILPICMSCKEIRDEEGAWHQLEKYICEHSNATFSHGMCQKCMKKRFPEDA